MNLLKNIVLFATLSLFLTPQMSGQEADKRVGDLINSSNWFALEREYPVLQGQMHSPMLQKYAEAMIGHFFNQPELAVEATNWLLANAQEELGFDNISSMILVQTENLSELGLYAESKQVMDDFLSQIDGFVPAEQVRSHLHAAENYNFLVESQLQAPEIIRPEHDSEIPFQIEKAGRGVHIHIPVIINGKEYKFILDSGASSTFVFKHFADEVQMPIICDSIEITGIEKGIGKVGLLEEIQIGDIIFKHVPTAISPEDEAINAFTKADAVLGMDFIKRIKELRIYPSLNKIVFPNEQTPLPPTGKNLLIQNKQPYLETTTDKDERLLLHFDTGNVKTDLYDTYYQKHKTRIDELTDKSIVTRGGFGGIRHIPAYTLPRLYLKIGDCDLEMKDVEVLTGKTGEIQAHEDGSLGVDAILSTKSATINFDKMFLLLEK